jgi:hypothetical protein
MSWLDDGDEGGGTTLQWWKESFFMAASDLFKAVDECVGMDIQLHNLSWFVQEVQTARLTVQMLSEEQDWYQQYIIEQSLKQKDDDADYWGAEEEEENEVQDSYVKQIYDEMFALLKTALSNIKFLAADTEEWTKLGPQRRLGKNVWYNYRTFERTLRLHTAVVRIMDIARVDVFSNHYLTEPNFGVARKIRHPAVRDFWFRCIVPRVLASHTSMSLRTPPGVHPKFTDKLLACADAITQAPMFTLAEQLSLFLKLDEREMMVLPYLLGSGCCDHEFGGSFTMGVNPCCTNKGMEEAKQRWEEQKELVLLGPGGAGWADDSEKGAQVWVQTTKALSLTPKP